MPNLADELESAPRGRTYFGPKTDQVDERGVPLMADGSRMPEGMVTIDDVLRQAAMQSPRSVQSPAFGQDPFTTDLAGPAGQYSAEHAARVRQYQAEVESAQELRRQQELDRLLAAGVRPTTSLLRPAAHPAPHYVKSGQNVFLSDPLTGHLTPVVNAPQKEEPLSKFFSEAYTQSHPAPLGWEYLPYGESGQYTREKKPLNEFEKIDEWTRRRAAGGGGELEGSKKTLDKAQAAQILAEAQGDKTKARELARKRGFTF